jgi:cobalt-zinc-cadmium efflux system membrane fusion protein
MLAVAALLGLALNGCGGSGAPETGPPADAAPAATPVDDHSGWWCVEHGVPEEACALCNPKVATDFRQQGDWCEEHNRPESQCFLCNPDLEAKFAAQYEAKFGSKPPKPGAK